jgi:serine protease DegS
MLLMAKRSFLNYLLYGLTFGLVTTAMVLFITSSAEHNEKTIQLIQAADAGMPVSGPVSYSHAVKAAAPAVVNINTTKVVTVRSHPFFNDPLFRPHRIAQRQRTASAPGSSSARRAMC